MSKRVEKRKHLSESEKEQNDDEEGKSDDGEMSDEEGSDRIEGIYIPPRPHGANSGDTSGPRLIITKIYNNFFKSYAKDQVLGPFHKCFNAIVGPNGSGKSNIIDSMLFVFGYRATKIRSKKLSVLIHDSESYRNMQSCTVAVHFALIIDKEGDAYDIVPGSEFAVARTANKDGSSYYTLNDRKVYFKEVSKLLRKHGIDLDHNRFLILQGEVEQIALMKPKGQAENETGILEYLEDIIGTSRLKAPISALEDKMEVLNIQTTEKQNRAKLIKSDLERLREPMQDAISFLKLENEITTSHNFIYQRCIMDCEEEAKKIQEEFGDIDATQNEITEKLAAITKTKEQEEAVLKTISKKYEVLEKRQETLKEAFDAANNKDIKLQAEMTQINQTRKKNKELLLEEQKKLQELERIPAKNQETIDECVKKDKELSAKKEELEEQKAKALANLRSETAGVQEKKDALQTKLVELKKTVDKTKSALTIAESELKICISSEESEKEKLTNLQSKYENINTVTTDRTTAVTALRKKIPLTEKSLDSAHKELNTNRTQQNSLITDIRKKRAYLEESKASLQSSKSKGRVLDSLTQQKREGNCPGLFGRLGDLGAIDLQYDVAVCTACGPLDNIVVDTVNTAQWCIEFLRKHDIGRATFIALEKQEHFREKAFGTIDTPENVPRLYDLIRTNDDRVRTAFYYALRDTLVAKDIDQASRIAYGAQRYRVVTLGGDVIEMIGTMSGGGKSVLRGRMGQSVTTEEVNPKDLHKVEVDLESLESKMRELKQRQNAVESQIATLDPELNKMRIDLKKFVSELQSVEQQKPLLETQLREQERKTGSTKADPEKVKALTSVIKQHQLAFEQAVEAAEEVEAKVRKLTDEIKEKTVGQMRSIDKKLKEVNNYIDNCNAEITRLQVGIKTAARNAKKSAEKIATLQKDIETAETRLRKMKAEREEIEGDAQKLLASVESVTTQLADGEDEYSSIKQTVAKLVNDVNKLKAEKIEIDQKHKTFTQKLNDIKAKTIQYRAKLQKLVLSEIPDEELPTLKQYEQEELLRKDLASCQKEVHLKEAVLKDMKPNLEILEEYRKKNAAYMDRCKEAEEVNARRSKVKEGLNFVRTMRRDEFVVGFDIIKRKLKEMYQMITLGGDADFELTDVFDPFAEGVQFNVRPPKKSWKIISNLSGGEKTLSSLALVFALHHYKPSPLYIMDEIDAALDFRNVSIVGNYIKTRTKNAQFIIISLRSNMFELCDNLIGIYKIYNCTRCCCMDPRVHVLRTEATNQQQAIQPSSETISSFANGDDEHEQESTHNGETNAIESAEGVVDETLTFVASESVAEENDEVIDDSMEVDEDNN